MYFRYSSQELKCLPVNTVLEKVQIQLHSKVPVSSSVSISFTTTSIPLTVSTTIPNSATNPSSIGNSQKPDSVTSDKVKIVVQYFCKNAQQAYKLLFKTYSNKVVK